ncbi:hypothetical protein [Microbispora sp. ATCC PTA-5024]|nr:hypothetical protein [Microbispora sp. ATCC PTA-5024]ETK31436.1 hypothetical protein MPTA5024_35280 [Microbispora sp. ATCC PTA-5024]
MAAEAQGRLIVNRRATTVAGVAVAALISGLNGLLLVEVLTG